MKQPKRIRRSVSQEQAFVENFILDRYPPPNEAPILVWLPLFASFIVLDASDNPPIMGSALDYVQDEYGTFDYWNESHRTAYGKRMMFEKRNEGQ